MIRPVAKPLGVYPPLSTRQGVAKLVSGWRTRRVGKRALERAYREFRATHTHCAELCFDWHFLLNGGAEALTHRDAQALAYAWTMQFRYRDERRRQRDVRQLIPLARSFLELLGAWEGRLGLPS